jgi:hypothetical protein
VSEKEPVNRHPPVIKRTRISHAVLEWLLEDKRFITTKYGVYCGYVIAVRQKPDLKPNAAFTIDVVLQKIIKNLRETQGFFMDSDYSLGYRIPMLGDEGAEEVCALASPLGYIAYLSAMQHWGLTNRTPEALHLVMPETVVARTLLEQQLERDIGASITSLPEKSRPKLPIIHHPPTVRGRKISTHISKQPGDWLRLRGKRTRLATVGQTFLDMLEEPDLCGGMAHVRDVWREHAVTYRDDIISAVDKAGTPIAKVRAGYFFDEMLGMNDDSRIQNWLKEARRGGSRRLDPTKPLSDNTSKKWMLSINV